MKKLFLLLLASIISLAGYSQEITGSWSGALDVMGNQIRLVFNITDKDGVYSATMDSPDQGAMGIPTTSTTFAEGKLKITASNMGAVYEGEMTGETIEGNFKQGGYSFPLNLKRGKVELSRPQNPKEPYPYRSEEVSFENKDAGVTLAGTLTYPRLGSKFPAVVLVSGSGPQDRDGEIMGHKPFLVLADYLTRNGIAVLRFDDRGFAKSGGDLLSAAIQDFAADVMAGVDYLKGRREINHSKIGLVGHSMGGTIAINLAADNSDIAFVVSMAGFAIEGNEFIAEQRLNMFAAMGMSQSDIDRNEEFVARMNKVVAQYTAEDVFRNPSKYAGELLEPAMRNNQQAKDRMAQELQKLASPELQSIINYNPAEDLTKIKSPVFAIYGGKDLQVIAATNIKALEAGVKSDLTTKIYPDLNHLFQSAQTGLPNEYNKIEETLSPEVMKDISDWIIAAAKRQ